VLHGIAYGLAIDISVACDIRLATSDTRFSVKEVDIGIAADIGTLSRLPKVVGSFSWVKDVALTARVFGAEEAQRVGYVSTIVDGSREEGVKAGLKICKTITEKSPVAVWGTKELLNYSRERPVEEGLRYACFQR
jgi:delta(3,5)-delta(2,4)-dienoyl-CoA isomerase